MSQMSRFVEISRLGPIVSLADRGGLQSSNLNEIPQSLSLDLFVVLSYNCFKRVF